MVKIKCLFNPQEKKGLIIGNQDNYRWMIEITSNVDVSFFSEKDEDGKSHILSLIGFSGDNHPDFEKVDGAFLTLLPEIREKIEQELNKRGIDY